MKQTMQNKRSFSKIFLVLGLLLFLIAGIFGSNRQEPNASPCASFALAGCEQKSGTLPPNYDKLTLTPGGMPFGVRFFTKGVVVVGVSDVVTENGSVSPARDAGIYPKDVIIQIDGMDVNTTEAVSSLVERSGGKPLALTIKRGEETKNIVLTPVPSKPEGIYRAGVWIRDSTAGIGTVTMYDKESGVFWGLGHGICDMESAKLLPLLRANVSGVTISGITKGLKGAPGELKGYFGNGAAGTLTHNTNCGVRGHFDQLSVEGVEKPLPLAYGKEVKEGDAYIYCTLSDNTIGKYTVKIEKLREADPNGKDFVIRITDPKLLETTGGIVQGMSGSPVIQNGKIVGAITHVLVADPTAGYGIFIENMLKATA
jgi:stage IV sporulation protein B